MYQCCHLELEEVDVCNFFHGLCHVHQHVAGPSVFYACSAFVCDMQQSHVSVVHMHVGRTPHCDTDKYVKPIVFVVHEMNNHKEILSSISFDGKNKDQQLPLPAQSELLNCDVVCLRE